MKYAFPHHLAKRSLMWTWATLTVPYVQGTIKHKSMLRRNSTSIVEGGKEVADADPDTDNALCWDEYVLASDPSGFFKLYRCCRVLWFYRLFVVMMVSVAAAPFL